jgi:sec-independent protein translocase protein TatA
MGIGLPELLIILVIVFLVFGAGKLPEVMGQLGKGIHSFKEGAAEKPKIAKVAPKAPAKAAAKVVAKAKSAKKSTKQVAARKPAAKRRKA